ncbi:MAG TPA: hypothetical protein VK824_00925 [Planctomycetota bacterium]|nr:hypothetical protein [Planctomycetota bacterium]
MDGPDGAPDELPSGALAALRAAWTALPAPPPVREPSEEDEATRRTMLWLTTAWRATFAVGADGSSRAPPPLRAAQRTLAERAGAARAAGRMRATRLTGWRRELAAAAVVAALLSCGLLWSELADTGEAPAEAPVAAARPRRSPPAASAPAPGFPTGSVARSAPAADGPGAPAPPGAARGIAWPNATGASSGGLLASRGTPPLELHTGRTRLLLFTDASRPLPENQP